MKRIFTLAFVLAIFWSARAQEGVPQEEPEVTPQEELPVEPQAGRKKLSEEEIPQLIMEAFYQSKYQGMTLTEAYELKGAALEDIPTTTQDPKPEVLYELQVTDTKSGSFAILYFTQEGTLYDIARKV